MLRGVVIWALALLAAMAAAVLSIGWRWVRPRRELALPDLQGTDAQGVCFSSLDGIRLHGLYLAGKEDYPTLILCHGYARSLAEPWEIGLRLNQAGYNTFLLDFRASGRSGGPYTTLGYKETWDLLAAVRFVKRAYGREPIAVLAISMGAAAALMAAAQSQDIAAVVADSPYADLQGILHGKVSDFALLPWLVPLGWLSVRFGQRLAGFRAADVRPGDYIHALAPRPLLIIYGQQDSYVPAAQVQHLYRQAGEPKELWVAPGSHHTMARLDHPQEYLQRVLGFFDRYLLGRQAPARAQPSGRLA